MELIIYTFPSLIAAVGVQRRRITEFSIQHFNHTSCARCLFYSLQKEGACLPA
jgi:hypothetical protein